MIVRDWRDADTALMHACYAREHRSWQDDLGWDTAWTWETVEEARRGWGLPGALALDDDGTLLGWGFAMPDAGALHVGGLVSANPSITAALLDALLDNGSSAPAACFVRDRAPGLADALARKGWQVERFLYLARPLTPDDARLAMTVDQANAWRDGDFVAAAGVLQAAYTPAAGRHFVPTGALAEWAKYLSGVVHQAGCGRLEPVATRVARDVDGLQAVALVTSIGAGTMHLAQLAVRPELRGCGVATRLVREAMASAATRGAAAMTLLVGEHNHGARRLYDSLGFTARDVFIAARTADQASVTGAPAVTCGVGA
jgi:ribosomal protein S18 acetylase RimI-like enzyme